MTSTKGKLVNIIYKGVDPFVFFSPDRNLIDFQGWQSDHPYLAQAIDLIRPSMVLEVGVWKGMSVITMAEQLKAASLDSCVLAVDTFLGSVEHWCVNDNFHHLSIESARPRLLEIFMSNVVARGLSDYVVPLPLDSVNAGLVAKNYGLQVDLLHIDAGHDYRSVSADLEGWWPTLRAGGIMICDDYCGNEESDDFRGNWPEVKKAVDDFCRNHNSTIEKYSLGKCWINKN